ncbi:MAG: hypothetical protein D6773_06365, partial [Alphaproteobacteria bacterium]
MPRGDPGPGIPPWQVDDRGGPLIDPRYEHEPLADTAARRGQQIAAGAADVVASVPEAIAIGQWMSANALKQLIEYQTRQIDAVEKVLDSGVNPETGEPLTDEMKINLIDRRNNYLIGLKRAKEAWEKADKRPAAEREVFKQGDAIRNWVTEKIGAPDPNDTGFWGQVAYGVGNLTAIAAGSILTGPAGTLVGAGLGANQSAAQTYKEARAKGASEEDAIRAARLAFLVGATEIIPLERALHRIEKIAPNVYEAVGNRIAKALQSGGEEAAQETIQQILGNLIAQGIYDPERGWADGVADSAAVGAVVGALAGTVGGIRRTQEEVNQPAPAQPPSPSIVQPQPPAPPAISGPPTIPGRPMIERIREALS